MHTVLESPSNAARDRPPQGAAVVDEYLGLSLLATEENPRVMPDWEALLGIGVNPETLLGAER